MGLGYFIARIEKELHEFLRSADTYLGTGNHYKWKSEALKKATHIAFPNLCNENQFVS